jgi:L-iditol 2-dehydrogenase
MRRVIPFIANGRMRAEGLITHHFALEDYDKALATFNDRSSGAVKIIVNP